MFWLKSCPRCKGDLAEELDTHGSFVSCMQCGCQVKAHEVTALKDRSAQRRKAASPERKELVVEIVGTRTA